MVWLCLAVTISALLNVTASAQVARIEIRPIETVTLKDSDLLGGHDDLKPALIGGELRISSTEGCRFPAVILLHGSGGLGGWPGPVDEWSRELNQLGIATFALDSF